MGSLGGGRRGPDRICLTAEPEHSEPAPPRGLLRAPRIVLVFDGVLSDETEVVGDLANGVGTERRFLARVAEQHGTVTDVVDESRRTAGDRVKLLERLLLEDAPSRIAGLREPLAHVFDDLAGVEGAEMVSEQVQAMLLLMMTQSFIHSRILVTTR